MNPSKATPREYLLQTIDAEIKSLEESLQALRYRRNELAPISSLPTEVIEAIFSLLRVPDTSSPSTLSGKPDHLRVAHVCHHWREIALNQPLFWSHIDATTVSSAGAVEILARARMAPLHLEAKVPLGRWDDARFDAFRKQLQAHVSHIRHLALGAGPIQLNRTLNGLTSPAPTLEYLYLSRRKNDDGTGHLGVYIPDTLFDGSAPRLSCLEIHDCAINWTSPLLRGLEHLDIHTTSNKLSAFSDWLDALDEMPQLKTLTLEGASPYSTSLPSNIDRTVTLPSLTLFKINSTMSGCGRVLAHLVLPSLTTLCIRAGSYYSVGSDVLRTLPHVARLTHTPQHTQPLQSVFVCSNTNSSCIEILAATLPDLDIELSNYGDTNLRDQITPLGTMHTVQIVVSDMQFPSSWSPGTHTRVFDAMMAVFPLDNLVTLTAQKHTQLDKQFWLHHAPQWPLLQRMRLAPPAARGFREMLLQEDNGGRQSPLLPSLKNLVLFDAVLSARRILLLRNALVKRVEQGVPLETLDLRMCLATPRVLELLSEIVFEVLGPEDFVEETAHSAARGLFAEQDSSGVEGHEDTDNDNEI
jgi:hypothetical protein